MGAKELDALLVRVAQGDNGAFGQFYEATAKGVFTFAYSYLGNREDAEDVMQNAYIAVKRRAYTDKKGTNARAWLLQIVKNLAIDELRRRRRRGELAENTPAPPAADGARRYMSDSNSSNVERNSSIAVRKGACMVRSTPAIFRRDTGSVLQPPERNSK